MQRGSGDDRSRNEGSLYAKGPGKVISGLAGEGVTIPPGSIAATAAVLAQADDLLYRVKHSGRQGFAV